MKFTITRDTNADAGYMIGCISVKFTRNLVQEAIIILSVKHDSPASIAGMSDEYVGWEVIAVNDEIRNSSGELAELLNSTKKPNNTFTIELRRIFAKGSGNELALHELLNKESNK